MKKQFIHYYEELHGTDKRNADETTQLYNTTARQLESILNNPIKDYQAFKIDPYTYAIEAIKEAFPKPFELGLNLDQTLAMLAIDLTSFKVNAEALKTTPHKYSVSKEGIAGVCEDKEPYNYYIDKAEQFERQEFAKEIIRVADKAVEINPMIHKGALIGQGFKMFVSMDSEGNLIPNWNFIYYGN